MKKIAGISPEQLRLLDCLFDGVYIADRQRRIIFWNRGAEEITGYKSREVCGRRCSDDILNHIDENGISLCRHHCPLATTLSTGQRISAKVYPLRKSGRRFPVETNIAPIRDSDGNIVAAIEVFRDVTQNEEFRLLQDKFNRVIEKYVSSTAMGEIRERVSSGNAGAVRERDLTIMYADIADFTSFSESHPAETVVLMLNDVFEVCDLITREFSGDIDKFIGDEVMAVFIDANDAVAAGEAILKKGLPKLNRIRKRHGQDPVRIRIGLNSGSVLQADIGAARRRDLTVVGDAVNVAKRITAAAAPGSLLISEATWSRLKNPGKFEAAGGIPLKGKRQPVRAYRMKERRSRKCKRSSS